MRFDKIIALFVPHGRFGFSALTYVHLLGIIAITTSEINVTDVQVQMLVSICTLAATKTRKRLATSTERW